MKRKVINSSRMPVYRDSGFELYDASTTSGAFSQESEHRREPDNYIYSRYRNPSVVSAEEQIMKLEGCSWALLTQSGMSAIDTALSLFQNGQEVRPWLFFTEIYGGTISFVESILKNRRGLDVHYFSPEDGNYNIVAFEKEIDRLKPELIYIESISNPMLIVADVDEITHIAKKYGSSVIIDLVIHSATKYFSGHGNITAGVICGNDTNLMKSAIEYRKFVGHMLSPDDAYRLETQIQTFELRFSRQCENAAKLAHWLCSNSLIGRVLYPGLKTHPSGLTAEKLFRGKGYGAMITFDFSGKDGNEKRSRRDTFIRLVSEKIKLIPTLGDPHTILMPVEAVWGAKYPEPGMIRLSVGFEDYSELEKTIFIALNRIEKDYLQSIG
jgi:cystathionine beta-lyase/cystathionine gamma-synthase